MVESSNPGKGKKAGGANASARHTVAFGNTVELDPFGIGAATVNLKGAGKKGWNKGSPAKGPGSPGGGPDVAAILKGKGKKKGPASPLNVVKGGKNKGLSPTNPLSNAKGEVEVAVGNKGKGKGGKAKGKKGKKSSSATTSPQAPLFPDGAGGVDVGVPVPQLQGKNKGGGKKGAASLPVSPFSAATGIPVLGKGNKGKKKGVDLAAGISPPLAGAAKGDGGKGNNSTSLVIHQADHDDVDAATRLEVGPPPRDSVVERIVSTFEDREKTELDSESALNKIHFLLDDVQGISARKKVITHFFH